MIRLLRYVAKDLEALKPDLLILPHTIYNALGKRRRKCLFEDHGNLIIVGCLQFAGLNSGRRHLVGWHVQASIPALPPTSTGVSQWNSIHRPQAGCG